MSFISAFNLAPFNRSYTANVYLSVSISTLSEVDVRINADVVVAVVYDITTDTTTPMIREIPHTAEIESATEILAQSIRERMQTAAIASSTQFDVSVRYSHADTISFTGDFDPGDKLVIDTKKQTVTLNGVNALHMVDGDFFDLILGKNAIKYEDNEAARSILTRITHRDRYLY